MRGVWTFLAILCLFHTVSASGDFRKSGPDTALEPSLESAFFGNDTIPIIHWTFYSGMPANVIEVGGVSVVSFGGSNVLKVTVSGGGSDYIQQTIPDISIVWYSCSVYVSKADTNGWANNETTPVCYIRTGAASELGLGALKIILTSGAMKWRILYYDDDGSPQGINSTATISTDTWYRLKWYIKKGASAGISNLEVNGVADVINVTTWNNNASVYSILWSGGLASTLDAIYYIRDVKFWSREGLP